MNKLSDWRAVVLMLQRLVMLTQQNMPPATLGFILINGSQRAEFTASSPDGLGHIRCV